MWAENAIQLPDGENYEVYNTGLKERGDRGLEVATILKNWSYWKVSVVKCNGKGGWN